MNAWFTYCVYDVSQQRNWEYHGTRWKRYAWKCLIWCIGRKATAHTLHLFRENSKSWLVTCGTSSNASKTSGLFTKLNSSNLSENCIGVNFNSSPSKLDPVRCDATSILRLRKTSDGSGLCTYIPAWPSLWWSDGNLGKFPGKQRMVAIL